MSYKVGQVLYLLLNKESRVFPVQVVEVVLRKSLDGEQVSYSVKMPTRGEDVIDLDKIDANVFLTATDLQDFMNENAQKTIASLVQQAQTLAKDSFQEEEVAIVEAEVESIVNEVAQDQHIPPPLAQTDQTATIDLGGGVKARINLDNMGGA